MPKQNLTKTEIRLKIEILCYFQPTGIYAQWNRKIKDRDIFQNTEKMSFQLDAQSFSYLGQDLIQKEFKSLTEILSKQNPENTALQEKLCN